MWNKSFEQLYQTILGLSTNDWTPGGPEGGTLIQSLPCWSQNTSFQPTDSTEDAAPQLQRPFFPDVEEIEQVLEDQTQAD